MRTQAGLPRGIYGTAIYHLRFEVSKRIELKSESKYINLSIAFAGPREGDRCKCGDED
jgi:hypothetical protein